MSRVRMPQGEPPYRLTNFAHQARLLHAMHEQARAAGQARLIAQGATALQVEGFQPWNHAMAIRRLEKRIARHRNDTSKYRRPHQGARECERRARRFNVN